MNFKLLYMGNIAGLNGEQIKDIEAFVDAASYVSIGTFNAQTGVRLSALSNIPGQKAGELYFITDLKSDKAKNIQANPNIEIMYTTDSSGIVIFSGKAEILTDTAIKQAKFQPWVNEFFPKGVDDENYCVLRFTPESIRAQLF